MRVYPISHVFPTDNRHLGARLYQGNIYALAMGNLVQWEKQIKASFPAASFHEGEGKEGARGEKYRGRAGGWKWSGDSALCECLCAALAKKNKA